MVCDRYYSSKLMLVVLGLVLGVTAATSTGEEMVEVNLKQGVIQAYKADLDGGKHYYAFKNIPFAKPPVGSLRFKDPVPAGPWTGVKNGSEPTKPCLQYGLLSLYSGELTVAGDEDCLRLDVYTPKPSSAADDGLLPVMVWIHGGGFSLGEIEGNVPTALLKKDVVVVGIQYRLSTLGFLSTDDSVIPGNRGLKDQVMALRWVQQNIRDLGGDPNKVTIFGESAGGISVHLHMMSPMSKGLFKRAIAQSGTALLPGFFRTDHRQRAAAIGQMLQCPGFDPENLDSGVLLDCLQDASKDQIMQASYAFVEFMFSPQVMLPSVDGEFLVDEPATLLRRGDYHKVDFMTGVTKDEGGLFVRFLCGDINNVEALAQNFSKNGPLVLGLEQDKDTNSYMAKRIFYHYLGGFNITEDKVDIAAKMFGDLIFNVPLDISAKIHSRDVAYGNNVFLYEFHYRGGTSVLDSPNIAFGKEWVSHADELQYLFDSPYFPKTGKDEDEFVSHIMATLWTNFAATGNPTPNLDLGFKWSPLTNSDLQYLLIKPSPKMQEYVRQEEFEFLTNLPTKQNKLLYPERFALRTTHQLMVSGGLLPLVENS